MLEQGSVEVDAYFPRGVWYNILDHESVQGPANVRLEAPLNVIPVHIRGGSVIPTQEPGMTTVESRKLLFGLLVALDEEGSASGFNLICIVIYDCDL